MIGNDGGGGEEMVRSSFGRSFQRRGAVIDMDHVCVAMAVKGIICASIISKTSSCISG